MTCWPGSHNMVGASPPFAERVWRVARRLCPHGVPAALLLIRPLTDSRALEPRPLEPRPLERPPDETFSLEPLARELRTLLRRSDAIVVEAQRGIAVVLVGADQRGARIVANRVAERLRAGHVTTTPTTSASRPFTRIITLGIGYSALTLLRPLDCWHADGALRAAERPRLRLACPIASEIAAEDSAHVERAAELAKTLEAPRPRLIRTGGQRRDERLPVLLARETRQLAVGAPFAPSVPIAAADDALPARGHLLTLSAPISSRSALAMESTTTDQRDRLRLRALSLGVPFLHLPSTLPPDCAGTLSVELAREWRAVPVGRTATALTIALDTRWDARTLFRLRAATGLEIFPVLTQPDELERALGQFARWG